MSDTPHPPEQTPTPAEHELSVDLAAFLPDGVELAGAPDGAPDGGVDVLEAGDVDTVLEDPAERAADEDGSGPDLDALGQFETDLGGVDAALLALDAGTYGTCAACGATIADDLLATDPTRLGCADHPGATPTPVSAQ